MKLVENEILRERRRLAGRSFALLVSPILIVLALAQGAFLFVIVRHAETLSTIERCWLLVLAASALATLAAGWKGWSVWKNSGPRAGRMVDGHLAGSKNRLEASAALSQADDPLARAQKEEASDYLAAHPVKRRSRVLVLLVACCAALLILNGMLVTKMVRSFNSPPAIAQAKKPVRAPYARIDIVAPESQTRATPIEEVVVKGDADSDNGFTSVSMLASINGGPDKSIPIDAGLFKKGGESKFDQSLLLDELNAQPYDIIAYYLQGISRHATPLKVSSQLQFIEVRPFREDIHKMPPGDGEDFDKLKWLISQQVIISKRTWIIASDPLPASDPTVAVETGKTGEEQDKIASKTHELFQEMTTKGLPASIVDHVSQAEQSMHQAVDKIRKPALLEANPIQQHALGELVAATKDFVKEMEEKSNSSSPSQEDPFKDKQKLPPNSGAAANSMAKLHELIKREQDIVKGLSPSPADGAAPSGAPQDGPQAAPNQGAQDSGSKADAGSPSAGSQGAGRETAQGTSAGQTGQATGSPPHGAPQSAAQGASPGQTAKDQGQIGRELGDLQNQPTTPASSSPALTEAQQAAQDSADKLGSGNAPGALNDARAAEAAMLRAQIAMETEAGQQMRDALAQAQQELHAAAQAELQATSPAQQAGVKDQAGAARNNLVQAQNHQATSGDPKLAQIADGLVKQYDQSGIPGKLTQLGNQPSTSPTDRAGAADVLNKLGDQLSAERLAMQSETQNLEDTLKRIDRVQHNMDAAHGTPEQQAQLAGELATDLKTALSDGKALLPEGAAGDEGKGGEKGKTPGSGPDKGPDPGGGGAGSSPGGLSGGGTAADASGRDGNGGGSGGGRTVGDLKVPPDPTSPIAFLPLREPLAAFRLEIEHRLDYLRSQTALSYLNPDQSPEEYRAQVAAYYERISRETKAAAPSAPSPAPTP